MIDETVIYLFVCGVVWACVDAAGFFKDDTPAMAAGAGLIFIVFWPLVLLMMAGALFVLPVFASIRWLIGRVVHD